jgi:hypothetical protein
MKKLSSLFLLILCSLYLAAQDTITVQTLTFDSITGRRGTWQFPEGQTFRKILMYHTLKCDAATTQDQYPCGEWDYLTYNIIYRHTGVYDSTLYYHPNFTLIEGTAPDSLLLSSSPTFYYLKNRHFNVNYMDTVSYLQAQVGAGEEQSSEILTGDHSAGRSQFLWKAEELINQGFTAGPITGIKLNVASGGNTIAHFMIRMRTINIDEIGPDTIITRLDTVYYNESVLGPGWQDFNFYRPFEWDGISDIVLDFSYTNPETTSETALYADDPGFNCGTTSVSNNYALDLDGVSDYLQIPADTYFNSDFTFETWFMKRSNNNWSRIFDFGNGPGEENVIVVLSRETSGKLSFHINKDGYSRSFEMADATPLNEWTHVTLRLTGNIGWAYINGSLAKYGLLQTPPNQERSVNYIGRSEWAGDKMADVLLDEFRLYKTALAPAVIKAHYRQELTDPSSDTNLVLYYKFDEGAGTIIHDSALGGNDASAFGYPNFYHIRGPEIYLGFHQNNIRPQIIFERLESNISEITEVDMLDSVMNTPTQVVLFQDVDNPTVPTDTIMGWQAGWQPVYENWNKTDSVWAQPGQTLRKEMLPYYGEPFEIVDDYEIGRYITPYGINLSLGGGFTWIYDVTDYAPLLHGMVDLSAGNQQELIDLKFVFITGTPPRNVLKIDKIWGGLRSFYYKDLDDDVAMSAVTLPLLPEAKQFKVKTRLSGHGQQSNNGEYPYCCEWQDNVHYLLVNSQQVAAWHIFQYHDCALNPVYPQGGTWNGAREGWCPGDIVKEHDYEITDYVTGSQVTLDYDITPVPPDNQGMGWGNYVTNMDLIQYGDNYYDNDAEIYDIISPNDYQYYSRINPICYGPAVILRNNGSSPLQSLTFNYGISGGPQETWQWNGNLPPHISDTVSLPVPGYFFWIGDENHIFTVTISEPNGLPDDYADNDSFTTHFNMPDLINIPIVTVLKTNNMGYRYTLTVRDIDGNVLLTRENLGNDEVYKDTLDYAFGCYSIELTDSEDMGLSYWAYPEQGNGYFRLTDLEGNIMKSFNGDFGRKVYYTFNVSEGFYINEPGIENMVNIYPNPSDGPVNIDIQDLSGKTRVDIFNPQGKLIRSVETEGEKLVFDLSDYPAGLYLVEIQNKGFSISRKVIVR